MIATVTGQADRPDPGAVVAGLVAGGFEVAVATTVTTTVLDTFDGRLHAAGLRLEHRDGALVLRGNGTVPAQLSAARAPGFASDLPPGPFRARLSDIVEVRALLPLLHTVDAHARSRPAQP